MKKLHQITTANYVKASNVKTVITFRTQQLLDLWLNEMQGQISDGMWENSRGTEWIWRGTYFQLGDTTKVETINYGPKKTSYPLSKELYSCIEDRVLEENGFESFGELKAAWKEINDAIKNYSNHFSDSTVEHLNKVRKIQEEQDAKACEKLKAEAEALTLDVPGCSITVSGTDFRVLCKYGYSIIRGNFNVVTNVFSIEGNVGTHCIEPGNLQQFITKAMDLLKISNTKLFS